MKYLSRGTLALMLVGLLVVTATGTTFAQEQTQNWDNAHPLEYYLALPGIPQPVQEAAPVSPQIAQVQVPNWDNAHPLEYYLALPGIPQPVQIAQVQEKDWDNAHPLEYYLALPGIPQPTPNLAVTMDEQLAAGTK